LRKTVITGGAGFVGSHLAEELSKCDYHVIILDDLSTGKLENIAPWLEKGKVEFIQDSITDLPLLQRLFRDIDFVFHLAAIASVSRSVEAPQECHEVNATGTMKVLIAARDNKVKKVVNASSCAVYGDAPELPKREDMLPAPTSPYATTKLAAEQYCHVFQQIYSLPTVSLRYFNIFGPRQDPESDYAAVIPRFIKMAAQGTAPVIYGDGEQSRDFIFVKDVVAANLLFAGSNASGIFNIGSGGSTTINRLAQIIGQLAGSKVPPVYKPPRAGDIKHSLADIAKARAFGYNPKYNLEAGLRETVRYMIS
jgi:UDP-glucose 4-epimerase